MFCPKCGSQLPDGAAFCGSCGNKLNATSGNVANVQDKAPSAPNIKAPVAAAAGNASIMAIVAIALCAIALIATFFPWIGFSSIVSGASGYISDLASTLGVSSGGSLRFSEGYSVWGFLGLLSTVSSYGMFTVETSTLNYMFVFILFALLLWVVAIIVSIVGTVRAFTKGKPNLLVGGSATMIVASVVSWVVAGVAVASFSSIFNGLASVTAMPIVCLIASIVAVVAANMAKKQSA